MYFSCVYDDDIRQYAGYNIALPATDFNECGYSKPLLERFQISTPVFESNALPERVSKQFWIYLNVCKNFNASTTRCLIAG